MERGYWLLISSFILAMGNFGLNPVRGQISWTPIYVDTSNRLDLWTITSTGCECPDGNSSNCACCVKPGGCLCSLNPNKCSQCGLEEYGCQRFCNVTISSRTVATRSGLSWVHLKSPELEGPTSCWWRLHSAPGQRIEVQIHRIVSVGTYDNSSQTCKDGFLQFADGDISTASTQAIQLCGQNSRYSPPVVMFGDQGMATLLLRIDIKSTSSQILAYVSFSSADDPTVGDPSRGGRLRPHSVCDWTYDNCWENKCILASPGYPGLFPPHRRCRYFLTANSTTDKIVVNFQTLNIPPPPLCSSHHIAIWKRNISNLAHLGPPWKTLCQHSNTTVEIFGGQALIEFRSGSTNTSPNLYNGFRASVEFIHAAIPTLNVKPTTTPERKLSHIISENSLRNKDPLKERNIEEPLGNPGAPSDLSETQAAVSCGQILDGNFVREKGFRLKIPKDLSFSKSSVQRANPGTHVTSSSKRPFIPFQCRIEFQGNNSDVIRLVFSSYKLRGSNCSSQIEVYDVFEHEGNRTMEDRLVEKFCGPSSNEVKRFTSRYNRIAIVLVVSPYESPKETEVLEGAFRFHDESIEGTVKPLSTCEVVYYGVTSSPSGSLTGPLESSLLRLSPLPLVCSYSFHPVPNQSVVVTLNSIGPDTFNPVAPVRESENYCHTSCSTSGCQCDSKTVPMDDIDHTRIVAGSTDLGCFCGSLSNVLPLAFETHAPLTLVFHSATSKGKHLRYNASYQFNPKASCRSFTISPPNSWKRWREILEGSSVTNRSSNQYTQYECSWTASIPRKQKLSLDLVSEENEKDCKAWNLTVWVENDKFPNRSDLLSSFCPEEGRKEVKVPNNVRKAFIKLEGVSMRTPQFEVRWKYSDPTLGSNRPPERMMSSVSSHYFGSTKLPILILSIVRCIQYL